MERLAHEDPEFVLTDLDLQNSDPLEILQQIRAAFGPEQVLLLASEKSMVRAAAAARFGLSRYMKKPVGPAEMSAAIRRARYETASGHSQVAQLVGSSPGIQTALKLALQVARRGGHLTLIGEAGVGKRLLARLIHENSPRSRHPFGHLSCEGLSERVVDGELFGRDDIPDGSPDAADGLLKQCHQGTLLIDEITKLPVRSQELLLKCITLKSVRPVGGRADASPSDVRIVAASSVGLEKTVRSGAFLRELSDRIGGVRVELAPLRERKSDIPMLADHFVRRAGRMAGRNLKGISSEGLDRLLRHDWPGNVRELEDMITHAVGVASGPWVDAEDLPALPEAMGGRGSMAPGSTIQEIEKEAILRTLDAAGGSTGRAATMLNMSVRKIQYKLKEYRRESASALRSETIHSVPPQPSSPQAPVPAKKTVFVADSDSRD